MDTIYESENLTIKRKVLGMVSNNVYLLESNGCNVIVDPSCRVNDIMNMLGGQALDAIVFTHYHFDHIGAGLDLKQKTHATSYASIVDAPSISGDKPMVVNMRDVQPCPVDKKLSDGEILSFGSVDWKVINTPGHTMGSICLYAVDGERPLLISGDTLFECGQGRTDFPDASQQKMDESLAKLATLPNETFVLPGHGNTTTIGAEKGIILPAI